MLMFKCNIIFIQNACVLLHCDKTAFILTVPNSYPYALSTAPIKLHYLIWKHSVLWIILTNKQSVLNKGHLSPTDEISRLNRLKKSPFLFCLLHFIMSTYKINREKSTIKKKILYQHDSLLYRQIMSLSTLLSSVFSNDS